MPSTLIIKDGRVFNPFLMQFEEADLVVRDGRVMHVGNSSGFSYAERYDASELYVIPGLIDIHFHLESTFLTPAELSRQLAMHGTLTVVADPHEIANVCGLDGVLRLIKSSRHLPISIYFQIPSCVPASKYEDSPVKFGRREWLTMMGLREVIAVGEVMSYERVISGERRIINLIREATDKGLIIEGHCPRVDGLRLSLYAFYGVNSDHTHVDPHLILERVRRGIFLEVQEKSLNKDNVALLNELQAGTYSLVTDDVDAHKLLTEGHLDHVVRRAIEMGLEVEKALYAATLSPALRMGLRDRGALTPGRVADVVIVRRPERMDIVSVFKGGELIYDARRGVRPGAPRRVRSAFPKRYFRSVKLRPVSPELFTIKSPRGEGSYKVNVMEVDSRSTFTRRAVADVEDHGGTLKWEGRFGLAASFNRYGKHRYALGLVSGSIMKRGAVATTFAHDSHNLFALGVNPVDIAVAVNHVIKKGGGIALAVDGEVSESLPLPLAGILSCDKAEKVATRMGRIRDKLWELGYEHFDPIKSITTMTLTVSPELKITPFGLFNVLENRLIGLFV